MLRAARELLAVRSPLDAELMVSELLGTWWGQRWPSGGRTPKPPRDPHRFSRGDPSPRDPPWEGPSPRPPLAGRWRGATVEQLVGEGLVDYAAGQRSPAALALLSGIACLGTPRQAAKAERAALDLISGGVPCPGWAEHLGRGDLGRVLHQPRPPRRPGRGHLRMQRCNERCFRPLLVHSSSTNEYSSESGFFDQLRCPRRR